MDIKIRFFRDSLSSYKYHSVIDEKVYEDEKGKYKMKYITKEVPCSCHPETCCHFGRKVIRKQKEKIYLTSDEY